jgi:serine phosphatase RsbU (regulator of sigma subunit)
MHRQYYTRLLGNAALVIIMVAPLIAASVWIYGASSTAFRYQHEIREAQEARNRLFRAFLAAESDVRGFAATGDPYFASAYRARVRTFRVLTYSMLNETRALDLTGESTLTAREQQTYGEWHRAVAEPILSGRRTNAAHLLRVVDPIFAARMSSEDHRSADMLNAAASESEAGRRDLLSSLLAGSIALVALVASAAIFLIRRHATAEQRELEQTLLYQEERRVSRILQSALTPGRLPSIDGVTLRAKYVPATPDRHIGGDWYEAVPLRRGRTLLIIGDVAGHGLEAAAIMNRVRHAILRAALADSDPARILQAANSSLSEGPSSMVTAACCIFDPNMMTLSYSTAGHPPPIIVPAAGNAYVLANGGPPLGVIKELELESLRYPLGSGALLVLYTDGLIEERRDVFMSEQSLLAAAARSAQSSDPSGDIFAALLANEHGRDDIAIVTMHVDRSDQTTVVRDQPRAEFPIRSSAVICSSRDTIGRA